MIDLDRQLELNPDAPFLVTRAESLTYGGVERLVAGRARDLGDRSGSQVVVRTEISVESVVEILAATRCGATAVLIAAPLPEDLAARQLAVVAQEARPSQSILFTSGSAGAPKGVRLTASNWAAAAAVSIDRLEHGPESRWLCPLPLHHVGGLSIIYRSMAAGGSVVLAPGPADLVAWIGRVHFASLVPTQLYRALEGRTDRLTNKPVVLVGGGRCEPQLLDAADAAGMTALPTYGMTETTSQVATARVGDPQRRLIPLDGVQIRIGNDDRIQVRGPTVSPGYVGEPERSPGAWFTTSDRGRVEPDGALVVTGRADRLIITGGEKVDPAEVESELESLPDVIEAAVVALPDREWGEVLAAAYVGTLTPENVRARLSTRLPAHAIPRRWLQMEALPRTELGKVDIARLAKVFGS